MIQLEPTYSDAGAVLLFVLVVSGYCLSKHLSNSVDIPDQYWYIVPQLADGVSSTREKKALSRDISVVWKEKDVDVAAFWGSQTGRAEALAKSFASTLESFGLRVLVADLRDYDHTYLTKLQQSQLCAFFLSTYGDGDPPDNTYGLWSALESLRKDGVSLSNLRYLIFGLGNRNYRQFNRVAETVDHHFQALGGKRCGEHGSGDDANGSTEDDFLLWRDRVIQVLGSILKLDKQEDEYRPTFKISEMSDVSDEIMHSGEPHVSLLPQGSNMRTVANTGIPRAVRIAHTRLLWESSDRLCLHVDLDLGTDRSIKYKTGDHLAILPMNPDEEVNKLVAALGMESKRDTILKIEPAKEDGASFPWSRTTVEVLCRYYLEISGPLSRQTVSTLVQFAPSEVAKREVLRLSADPAVFRREVLDTKTTLADLLRVAGKSATWNIPLSFLLERLKKMQPRFYSISSSTLAFPETISITAVVNKRPAAVQSGCYGLATGYLLAIDEAMKPALARPKIQTHALNGPRNMLSGHKTFAHVRQSAFKLPSKASTPIIMVGCGTGVAPFRAFVQERVRLKMLGYDVGKMMLFMGFRHPEEDYIYGDEWLESQTKLGDSVLEICMAFSREHSQKKVYVQDLLREHGADILRLLDDFGTRMYLCGSSNMSRDVTTTLAQIRAEATAEDEETANAWVKKLRNSRQLFEDVWS